MTRPYYVAARTRESHNQESVDTEDHVFEFESVRIGFKLVPDSHHETELEITSMGDVAATLDGAPLAAGDSVRASLPFSLTWPGGVIAAFSPITPEVIRSARRLSNGLASQSTCPAVVSHGCSPSPETLTKWFVALGAIQRCASSSPEFRQEAVRAIVSPGGLDAGFLLKRDCTDWQIAASHIASPPLGIGFESEIADAVVRGRVPLVYQADDDQLICGDADAVFAAPVFDENMEVTAVLYASRVQSDLNRRQSIRDLEALWVQLIAEAVTAGEMRLNKEAAAAKQRVLLERVFPQTLVDHFSANETITLPAEKREVTVMFADLVESSEICEGNSPELTCRFFCDVLESMTAAVRKHDGVIVDYYGDGLVAMWNAPVHQPDHALRACKAALEISRQLSNVNVRWRHQVGRLCQFGIGIHTGLSVVGNSGTERHLKYGPRGFTVNVAARIEKATRKLRQTILISDATRQQIPVEANSHRIGWFKLDGISQPVALHSLHSLSSCTGANPCCVAKHKGFVDLAKKGEYAAALEHLDTCTGCEFDDLSLDFLRQCLEDQSVGDKTIDMTKEHEPVFDLTK
ncbi:MAG: adenylate/guanylate cyclase domain-containing protein [Planctomycetales bacterium]|nr:adenylate/guanylate cyclase domain-containing protein [Planctomycetales bacterium]